MPTKTENMKLWTNHCSTDPKYTKDVSFGKRSYTAIDPQYQMLQATEEWGPYGDRWGFEDIAYEVVPHDVCPILVFHADFYYPTKNSEGRFHISADIALRPNDDCYKKVMTSARSKALSLLGFNADVFMGKFDDNQYVRQQEVVHNKGVFMSKFMKRIEGVKYSEELDKALDKVAEMESAETITEEEGQQLRLAVAKKRVEMTE